MIIDKTKIYLKAGTGGEGSISTMRLSVRRFIGGGGDGGDGGDVIIKVSPHLYDLSKFKENRRFIAQDGKRGKETNKKGKFGDSITLSVPEGTIVRNLEGNKIVDLEGEKQEFLICRGGRGGKGNYKKNYTMPAQSGQEKEVILDFRILNDVALLGFPNCGKTSLFNKLTGSAHKVADYPFTTTYCAWARAAEGSFTVMDMPPLKKSLPDKPAVNGFLKHLYRSKIIIFLSENFSDFEKEISELKREIDLFDEGLLKNKIIFYLLNKIDKMDKIKSVKERFFISVEQDMGLEIFKEKIGEALRKEES